MYSPPSSPNSSSGVPPLKSTTGVHQLLQGIVGLGFFNRSGLSLLASFMIGKRGGMQKELVIWRKWGRHSEASRKLHRSY
ncbi:hypothetical protein E3N88_30062 [Mikania micrantha]|uniref:Uncharacterized protein n=1 Tax=Mikania micrantha TaxID=192012 RepID=A0A5N6MLH4_9ASTR|nr:hypothetical protein E3N88_30062 [Mikania micrantha]